MREYKTTEQIKERIDFLKRELEEVMPSVIVAIGFGFMPSNFALYEGYAQELIALQNLLK